MTLRGEPCLFCASEPLNAPLPEGSMCMADPTFRIDADEVLRGPDGRWMRVLTCAELDPESGRWEPFISLTPAEPPLSLVPSGGAA